MLISEIRGTDVAGFASSVMQGMSGFDQPSNAYVTLKGERWAEELAPGDKVLTRDNGFQPILWVETSQPDYVIDIIAGALTDFSPTGDVVLPENHRVLVRRSLGHAEALVEASALTYLPGVSRRPNTGFTFANLMLSRHEVINMNNLWVESLRPSSQTLARLGESERAEFLARFPWLGHPAGRRRAYQDARRVSAPMAPLAKAS